MAGEKFPAIISMLFVQNLFWVMGGGINGGRIVGQQVKVEQAMLFQNRDYPILAGHRAIFRRPVAADVRPGKRRHSADIRRRPSGGTRTGLGRISMGALRVMWLAATCKFT
jgi:uncharacterized protein (DUF1501 family)